MYSLFISVSVLLHFLLTYIRELRNEISHDYPLLETDVAAILNELFSKTDIIFSIYSKLKSVFNNNRHA